MITFASPELSLPDQDHTPFAACDDEYFRRSKLTASTLAKAASAPQTWQDILRFHGDLATDDFVRYVDGYYRSCVERYGAFWRYMDIVSVLYAAARLVQPRRYLEIGVRRGRTVCTVARACPIVDIVGFDLWVENYAGMENPGAGWVRQELNRHGHIGRVEFVTGDSRSTVPACFAEHPDLLFDLITVDGDHSEAGARADLENVIPRLAPGGVLVFDDISHPDLPHMFGLWKAITGARPWLDTYEFAEAGYGVAFAVNRGTGES